MLVAEDVAAGGTRRLDEAAVASLQAHRGLMGTILMQCVSLLASGGVQAIVVLACLLGGRRRPRFRLQALSMILAVAVGEGLVSGLKVLFHRSRPAAAPVSLGYSFPSGHSFFAVVLYGMAAYWLTHHAGGPQRRIWPAALLLILLIGFSRVYLGVHYPSDVLAGYALAVPWLWLCLALSEFLSRMQTLNPRHEDLR